jgi:tetrahydromethanopterin S-methyltransferase subunit D
MTGASVGEAGRVRVGTGVTRLEGGAGAQAFRGARTLNQNAFEIVVITSSGVLGRR